MSEIDVGASLTIDHHRPRSHGGGDEDQNIVYCCPRCNEHKSDYWHESDAPHIRLLHPLYDDFGAHCQEDDAGQILGLTREGGFLIQCLRPNRAQLVEHRNNVRLEQRLAAEREALLDQVRKLEQDIADLHSRLSSTEAEIERENR